MTGYPSFTPPIFRVIDHHHRSKYSTCRRRSTDDIIRLWREGRTEQLLDNKIPQRAVVGRHVVIVVDVYHGGFVANNILLLSREMIVFAYRADRMFNLPHRGLLRQAMSGQQLMMRGWYCVSVALKVKSRGCLIQCHIGDNHDGVNAFGLSMNEY